MTQTMFAPAPGQAPEANETAGGRSRRTVVVAGGLAAALVLGAGGFFLLRGGSSSDDVATGAVPHVVKPVTKKAAPRKAVKASKPVVKVPAVSSVPIGRDPFHAQYVLPVEAPPAAAPATTTTTTTPTSGQAGTDTPTATAPYSLTLVKITGGAHNSAFVFTWKVGGTTRNVLAAQRFGRYGELVTLTAVKSNSGKVIGAVVQVGDDEPLGVKVGERITVK